MNGKIEEAKCFKGTSHMEMIGNTLYIVNGYYKQEGRDSIDDKIKRLIQAELNRETLEKAEE